jgi:uncharacterized repeat protein (TIGR04138 family)
LRRDGLAAGWVGGRGVSHGAPRGLGGVGIGTTLKMHETSIEEGLEPVLAKDARYHRDAYLFVRDALDFTKTTFADRRKSLQATEQLHVTGQELLAGIRTYALTQYGPMTMTVLEEWGVTRCEDFGEIVFNMVDAGLLSKTDSDSRDDFHGYSFEQAFRNPFLPQSKLPKDIKSVI